MITVILALLPALFYGIYNTGYQYLFTTKCCIYTFVDAMLHGSTKIVPMIAVSYIVGLAIEFAFAVFRGHRG
jgi:Na+-transporting NADH:ubiquinone oxidoreductase subunit B